MNIRGFLAGLGLLALALPASAELYGGRGGTEAVLFSQPGFGGETLVINGPVANLHYEYFDDKISSIDLSGTWEVCSDPSFRGRCEILNAPVSNLFSLRLSNTISSIRPVNARRFERQSGARRDAYGSRRRGATLYRDGSLRGAQAFIDGPVANLHYIGFDDTASSIAITSGTWLICEHPDFRGRCEVVDQTVYNLNLLDLNDRISSIAPYDGRDYGNQRRDAGYQGRGYDRDYGYNNGYGSARQVRFDDPRDRYGQRIRDRRGNAQAFCRDQGFTSVVEIERQGRYIGCVICSD